MSHTGSLPNLSDYLNRPQIEATAWVVDVCFVVSTLLFPVVVYLVFYEKSMGKYRWFILNTIVWDYAYDVLLTISYFKFPQWARFLLLLMLITLIINSGWSTTISMLYRFSQSYPGRIMNFFDKSKGVYVLYFSINISWYIVFEGPIIVRSMDVVVAADEVSALYGDRSRYDDTTLFLFPRTSATTAYLVTLCATFIFLLVCGTSFWITLLYRLRSTSAKKMKSYRLQIMLFRAYTMQMITGYTCLLLPFLVTALLLLIESKAAQTAGNAYFMLSSTHAVLDSIAVLYYITPYRRLLIKRFRELKTRILRSTSQAVTIVGVGENTSRVNVADSPTLTTF